MKRTDKIRNCSRKPKIFNGEFNPDNVVEKNNGKIIIIDSTTTARTDRMRGKQWDAYGTKKYFTEKGKVATAVMVVDETDKNQREKDNFRRCKAHCKLPHSALDDAVSVKELIDLLEKN